jgi:hypothetical protein
MTSEVLAKFSIAGARDTVLSALAIVALASGTVATAVVHPERITYASVGSILALAVLVLPWLLPVFHGAIEVVRGTRGAVWVRGGRLIAATPLLGFAADLRQIVSAERYDWQLGSRAGVNLKLRLRSGAVKQIACGYLDADPDALLASLERHLGPVA